MVAHNNGDWKCAKMGVTDLNVIDWITLQVCDVKGGKEMEIATQVEHLCCQNQECFND